MKKLHITDVNTNHCTCHIKSILMVTISQVCVTSLPPMQNERNSNVTVSSGLMFVLSFAKICHLVQKLRRGQRHKYRSLVCPYFFSQERKVR
jgi:hypothetical protein